MSFNIFRPVHTMSLPHLAAQGILVYPLCGLSQLRGPEVGADPLTCCAVRGRVLSKVVRLAIGVVSDAGTFLPLLAEKLREKKK